MAQNSKVEKGWREVERFKSKVTPRYQDRVTRQPYKLRLLVHRYSVKTLISQGPCVKRKHVKKVTNKTDYLLKTAKSNMANTSSPSCTNWKY